MVQWVVGSITLSGPTEQYLAPKVLLKWYNNGQDMHCPVCGRVHIKDPLPLIGAVTNGLVGTGFTSWYLL